MNLTQMKQYLSQLSSLDKLHKISFPEKPHHIEVPQLLSQFIAKYVLSLSEYDGPGKIFDAQVKEGKEIKYYEIKGTSSYKMSADVDYTKKPNVLVWVLVDVEKNEVTIRQRTNFNKISTMKDLYNLDDKQMEALEDPFERTEPFSTRLKNIKWDTNPIVFGFDSPPTPIVR